MYETLLLAAALQRWDRYSAHAIAARELAAVLARSASRPLHVLSVYEYDQLPARMTGVPGDTLVKLREEEVQRTDTLMRQKMEEYVAPLVGEGLKVTKLLRLGSARDVILQVARELRADLLVIGSHSKRGLLDIALGGTAQHLAKHAPCPVAMVSPKRD
jgi:nucleotide-binding universal stress UspA family protein